VLVEDVHSKLDESGVRNPCAVVARLDFSQFVAPNLLHRSIVGLGVILDSVLHALSVSIMFGHISSVLRLLTESGPTFPLITISVKCSAIEPLAHCETKQLTHSSDSATVACLDQQTDVCVHEGNSHSHIRPIRQDELGVQAELFDEREDVCMSHVS
jgi:hypothetical protein